MSFCSRCGKNIPTNAKYCMHCSNPISAPLPTKTSSTSKPKKESHIKRNILIIVMLVIVTAIVTSAFTGQTNETITQTPLSETATSLDQKIKSGSQIIILNPEINIKSAGVDKIHLDSVFLKLRNEDDKPARISELVISSKGDSTEFYHSTTLEPGEEEEASFESLRGELSKDIGIEQINLTIQLYGYPESDRKGLTKADKQVLAETNITISIPRVRIGDTIPEINYFGTEHNISLTILGWNESNIVVDGPYASGYYTFTAKPGMKFVILVYKFQNNWIREQETPYLGSDEIATDNGYIYSGWSPVSGARSEEYKPRRSTSEEVKSLIGVSEDYKTTLLPGESTIGCWTFEIPADTTPIEASYYSVPYLIVYEE